MHHVIRFLLFFSLIMFSISGFAQEESKAVEKRKEQLLQKQEEKKKMGEKAHEGY